MKLTQPGALAQYKKLVERLSPNSKMGRDCLRAFWVGGVICLIGQCVNASGAHFLSLNKEDASTFTAIVMVFLGATLTGLGVYDRIGKYAGGGSIIPITGFANSIVAPAMEFRREGLVMGVGAKLFVLAGPVLVYGVTTSVLWGVIVWLFQIR